MAPNNLAITYLVQVVKIFRTNVLVNGALVEFMDSWGHGLLRKSCMQNITTLVIC